MKNLIVGDKDCSINKIVSKISRLKQSQLLAGEWTKLAIELDASNTKMVEWRQDLLLKRKDILEVLIDLLTHWRSSFGEKAKFEHLLNIIGNDCGWKDVEDHLWKTFQSNMTEDITWEDLDTRSRHQVMESSVIFQGESITLKNICSYFDVTEVETMLQSKLPGAMILKLLSGERVTLSSGSIPETPVYYIPRNLVSRQRLNPEIFKHKCSDIFVIKEISLSELSEIASNECIAKTSNQQYKLTSRYILLDLPDGFEIIAEISNDAPVHQLNFKDGSFYWVNSSGSICLIHEYIHDDQDSVSEEEFLPVLQEEYNKNRPVCIADIPGMGKTCLLANLARQRQLYAGDKTLVLFIALSQFLDDADESAFQQDVCTDKLFNWITKFVSQNELGQEIVSKMLRAASYPVEIYFDGYDELPEHKQELTANIVKCLLKKGTYVHAAITTRVHKRHQLEQSLQVLSFNIQSFPPDGLVQLFKQIWSKKYGVPLNDNLHRFAKYVADQIRMTICPKNDDVVGVALQCNMLAEIFKNDALSYSGADSLPLELSVKIVSVQNIYNELMEKRFSLICSEYNEIDIKKFHVLAAIHEVLPRCISTFDGAEILQGIQLNEINSLGILTVETNGSSVKTQFLHHSYAEYILANFLVENLEHEGEWWDNIFQSVSKLGLFLHALSLSEDDSQIRVNTLDCDIDNLWKRICISGKAEKLRMNLESLAKELQMSDEDMVTIRANLKNNVLRGDTDACKDVLKVLLHHWTQNLKVCPKLRQLLNALRSMEFCELAENLKTAYCRPSFENQTLCFFINEALRRKQVSLRLNTAEFNPFNELSNLTGILNACLYHNYFSLFASISQQCISVKTYHPINFFLHKTLLLRSSSNLITLAATFSDLNLVTECCDFVESWLECKINQIEGFTTYDSLVYGPLHVAARRGDYIIFHYFFKKFRPLVLEMKELLHNCVELSLTNSEEVIDEKIQIIQMILTASRKFINETEQGPSRRSPLLMWDIHIKLLKRMIDEGADVKAINRENGNTVVHNAAYYLSPTDFHSFVEFLLKRRETAIFHVHNKIYKSTPVHHAAEFVDVKPKTVQLLSSKLGEDCFNNLDWEQDTALFCATAGLRKTSVLEVMVQCGGDPKRLRKDQQTIVHLAAIFGNVDAIRYFVSLGCSVNARDVHGRTALHLAFEFGMRNVGNVVKTLLDNHADANIKDAHGRKAIWYAENENKLWMLEPSTRREILEKSKRNSCTVRC